MILERKDEQLVQKDDQLDQKNAFLVQKDEQVVDKDTQLARQQQVSRIFTSLFTRNFVLC